MIYYFPMNYPMHFTKAQSITYVVGWLFVFLFMYVTAGIMAFEHDEDNKEFYQKFPKRHERLCIRLYYIIFWPLISFIKFIMFLFK